MGTAALTWHFAQVADYALIHDSATNVYRNVEFLKPPINHSHLVVGTMYTHCHA